MPKPHEQYETYYAMYAHFNAALFDGALAPAVLTFSRQSGTLGFFSPERWEAGGKTSHEIALNPSYLQARSPIEVASTLVHEMVHAWQAQHGTVPRGGYHDRQWAAKMDSIGLAPTSTGLPGGRRTGDRMTHLVVDGGPFSRAWHRAPRRCTLPWLARPDAAGKGRRAASKVKYTCEGECGCNVWGKPGLVIRCVESRTLFVAAEATDGDE